jgi:hypothetical protein
MAIAASFVVAALLARTSSRRPMAGDAPRQAIRYRHDIPARDLRTPGKGRRPVGLDRAT